MTASYYLCKWMRHRRSEGRRAAELASPSPGPGATRRQDDYPIFESKASPFIGVGCGGDYALDSLATSAESVGYTAEERIDQALTVAERLSAGVSRSCDYRCARHMRGKPFWPEMREPFQVSSDSRRASKIRKPSFCPLGHFINEDRNTAPADPAAVYFSRETVKLWNLRRWIHESHRKVTSMGQRSALMHQGAAQSVDEVGISRLPRNVVTKPGLVLSTRRSSIIGGQRSTDVG
jgi:hypothetical protein